MKPPFSLLVIIALTLGLIWSYAARREVNPSLDTIEAMILGSESLQKQKHLLTQEMSRYTDSVHEIDVQRFYEVDPRDLAVADQVRGKTDKEMPPLKKIVPLLRIAPSRVTVKAVAESAEFNPHRMDVQREQIDMLSRIMDAYTTAIDNATHIYSKTASEEMNMLYENDVLQNYDPATDYEGPAGFILALERKSVAAGMSADVARQKAIQSLICSGPSSGKAQCVVIFRGEFQCAFPINRMPATWAAKQYKDYLSDDIVALVAGWSASAGLIDGAEYSSVINRLHAR